MTHFDLIIAGSGVLGTFHAYHALAAGKKVLILEKDKRPQEATVRNFGQVVTSGLPVGEWNRYGREATAIYRQIQAEYDISIRNNGTCYIASDAGEMAVLEEMQQRFAADDYESNLLTPAQVLDKYPAVKQSYAAGGLFFPQEVSVEPERMIHRLHEYLRYKYGAQVQFCYHTPVIDIQTLQDKACITVAGGTVYTGEHALVCNGRDVKLLFPALFAASGLVVSKLNMMATYPQPEVKLPGNILTGLSIRRYESFQSCDAYEALDPLDVAPELKQWGIHLLFKQRIDGSIIIGDSHEYAPVLDQDDLSIFYNEMHINELMIAEAQKIVALPDWRMAQYWCGFYCQHNELDIFEHSIGDRIHIATGIGGKGMTTSAGYAAAHLSSMGIIAQAAPAI
ncbi:TIGR03364 family FAD-dependent oxidoreductase [Taibaiella koreensis]|uniref:TIGR03364 family FAD-dependent oxidoreductase n=1 Tax=Taibaiella koreensis TaxID=1268548 RepID=UPI000E59C1A0|nr:TIGR03364 family FAD-dependent oxidoreductase [Taibaiella koreensis]